MQLKFQIKGFCGVSKGWLITIDDENLIVTVLNPFSILKGRRVKEDSIISLPALNLPETCRKSQAVLSEFYVSKSTISADPISHARIASL